MADQTVSVILDVQIGLVTNQEGNINIDMKPLDPNQSNILLRFDVSSLSGKMWDSVVLRATYIASQASHNGHAVFVSRVLRDVNYATCTREIYDTGMSWSADYAENSVDNDHSTRVDINSTLETGSRSEGDTMVTPDITDMIKDGVLEASGIVDLIIYSSTQPTSSALRLKSIENSGTQASLFFSNVEDMEETTSSDDGTGTAANVAVPSASSLTKSGRPPIAGADRQVSATILHDGVEPMTILSITLKGSFGTDN